MNAPNRLMCFHFIGVITLLKYYSVNVYIYIYYNNNNGDRAAAIIFGYRAVSLCRCCFVSGSPIFLLSYLPIYYIIYIYRFACARTHKQYYMHTHYTRTYTRPIGVKYFNSKSVNTHGDAMGLRTGMG